MFWSSLFMWLRGYRFYFVIFIDYTESGTRFQAVCAYFRNMAVQIKALEKTKGLSPTARFLSATQIDYKQYVDLCLFMKQERILGLRPQGRGNS